MDLHVVSLVLLAGIVAKGLGAIAILFAVGVLVGVLLTLFVTSRIRRFRGR